MTKFAFDISTSEGLAQALPKLTFELTRGPFLMAMGCAGHHHLYVARCESEQLDGLGRRVARDTFVAQVRQVVGQDIYRVAYFDGDGVRVDARDVGVSTKLYFKRDQSTDVVVRVPEDECDDTDIAVVAAGERVTEVSVDQFYVPNGFLKLACSHELPADVFATALHAAWDVLKDTCDREVGEVPARRARA